MRKGFTLIELLAVILILGVIALIAVPVITNIIHDVEENSVKVNSSNYVRLIEDDISKKLMTGQEIVDGIYNANYFDVELKGEKPLDNSCVIITNQLVTGYVMHYEKYSIRNIDNNLTINPYTEGITCSGTFAYNPVNIMKRSDWGFHDANYKDNIVTATFAITKAIPANAIMSWDVSKLGDESVMAYVMPREDGNYDLYIGSDGGVKASDSLAYLFSDFSKLKEIDFKYLDTSDVVLMNRMFRESPSIISLDLSNFNTTKVTNMESMFGNCYGLINLNITSFVMTNVTNVTSMFHNCNKLKNENLNLNDWDTSSIVSANSLFENCRAFINLDLSNWELSETLNMRRMFSGTNNLVSLNISSFNTAGVTNMVEMFKATGNIRIINVGENFVLADNRTDMFIGSYLNESNFRG